MITKHLLQIYTHCAVRFTNNIILSKLILLTSSETNHFICKYANSCSNGLVLAVIIKCSLTYAKVFIFNLLRKYLIFSRNK